MRGTNIQIHNACEKRAHLLTLGSTEFVRFYLLRAPYLTRHLAIVNDSPRDIRRGQQPLYFIGELLQS